MSRQLILFACLFFCSSLTVAQDDNDLWARNFAPTGVYGTVKVIERWGDSLVIGGQIEGIRQTSAFAREFVIFDLIDRSWHITPQGPSGTGAEVRAVAELPNGDLVLGGKFSFTRDGRTMQHLAVLSKDGSWSTLSGDTSDFCNGPVNALLEFDGRLYIGGEFAQVGQNFLELTSLFAIWDPELGFLGTTDQPISTVVEPGQIPAVHALVHVPSRPLDPSDYIYAGGDFTRSPGDPLGNLVKVNVGTRTTQSLNLLGTNGPVYALERPGNPYYTHEVYIGGEFTIAGGTPVSNCAMYDHEDQTWDPLGDGLNGPVYAIEQKGASLEHIHFAGDVDSSGATPIGSVPGWNFTQDSWVGTELTTDDVIWALHKVYRGNRYLMSVGGEFEFVADSVLAYGVFQFSTAGLADDSVIFPLGDGLLRYNATVQASDVAVGPDGSFYVSGNFNYAGGHLVNYIAKWDGTRWQSLGDGLDNTGGQIAVNGDTVYVAGPFTMAAGVPVNRIAMWDGNQWLAMGEGIPDANVQEMVVDTLGNLYVAGSLMDSAGSVPVTGIARWDGNEWSAVGGPITTASAQLFIFDMYLDSLTNDLYICGQFDAIDGVPCYGAAKWDGSFWTPIGAPNLRDPGSPRVMERSPEGTIVVAGNIPRPEFVQWDFVNSWISYAGGVAVPIVTDLLTVGCHLYLTGDPLQYVGPDAVLRVYNLARWDGLDWVGLGTGTNNGVNGVAAHENKLAVVGDFTIAGGTYAQGFTIWNGVISGDDVSDLTLLTPAANDTLEYGTVFDITWDTATAAELVLVQVSLDSGLTWQVIHNRADGKRGRLPWVVPDTTAAFCKVRLSDGNRPCTTVEEDYTFTITADSTLESWWLTHAGGTYYKEPFVPGYTSFSFSNTEGNQWPDSVWKNIDYSGFPDPPDSITNFPDWFLYCEAYGNAWCYRNGDPDRPRSRAIKHWQEVLTKWSGSCLGFSTASLIWLYGNEFNTNLIIPYEPLTYLGYTALTRNAANKHWIYQNGDKHLEHDLEARALTPYETMDLIRQNFTAAYARSLSFSFRSWKDKLDDDSVVVDSVWRSAGHNVVPYNIQNVPDTAGIYYMYFCDPNAPSSRNLRVRIDSINNTWRMPSYYPNDTNCRFIPRLPAQEWYGLANDDRVTTGLKWAATSHFATVLTSATYDILIRDSLGNQIGWTNNESVEGGLEGGPIYTDDPDYPYNFPPGYLVPAGAYDIELSNHEADFPSFSLFTDSVAYFYRRDSAGTNVNERLKIGDGISVVHPSNLMTGVSVALIRTTDSTERYVELSEMTFSPIDSVMVDFDSTGAITFANTGIARSYRLTLWNSATTMAQDEITQSLSYVTVFGNRTQKIIPAWGMLESMPTLLLTDADLDGQFEDTTVLAVATSLEDDAPELPDTYQLLQNYPNPFNPATTIEFSLPVQSSVQLEIINVLGQRVKVLVNKELAAGRYTAEWNGTNESGQAVATGVYFYRLVADGFSKSRKMLLLK